MKKIMLISLLLIFNLAYAFNKISLKDITVIFNQANLTCDKILNYPEQTRCYSYKYHEPIASLYYIDEKVNKSYKKRLSFKEDPNIPEQFQNKLECYYKSGYDRGHLAPDADFDYNLTILKTTYYTSNVVPELPIMNRYKISSAEKIERKFATIYNGIYVLTGILPSNKKLLNKKNCANIPKIVYKIFIDKNSNILAIYLFENNNYDTIFTKFSQKIILNKLKLKILKK